MDVIQHTKISILDVYYALLGAHVRFQYIQIYRLSQVIIRSSLHPSNRLIICRKPGQPLAAILKIDFG